MSEVGHWESTLVSSIPLDFEFWNIGNIVLPPGFTEAQTKSEFAAAFNIWTMASPYFGFTENHSLASVIVRFENDEKLFGGNKYNAGGITGVSLDPNNHYTFSTMMIFNGTKLFPYTWTCSTAVKPNEVYFRNVALHEIGHLIGFDECDQKSAVMFGEMAPGAAPITALTKYDLQGLELMRSLVKPQIDASGFLNINGSVTPSGTTSYNTGDNVTYHVSANTGYQITTLYVDGSSIISAIGQTSWDYNFNNLTGDHTIAVSCKKKPHLIRVNPEGTGMPKILAATANGTIDPSGYVFVEDGANQGFTITPNLGYIVESVTVDAGTPDEKVVTLTGNTYTFSNVTGDHTITASFKSASGTSYTITASVDDNTKGSISPSGSSSVTYGSDIVYSITPKSGFAIWDVVVGSDINGDGVLDEKDSYESVGSCTTYTIKNVTSNHTIKASFYSLPPSQYTIIVNRQPGFSGVSTIFDTPEIRKVYPRSPAVISLSANPNCAIDKLWVDGELVEPEWNGPFPEYYFSDVQENHTVYVTYTCPITASTKDNNGVISPSGTITVSGGDNPTFYMTPKQDYYVENVQWDDYWDVGPRSSYTFDRVFKSNTISASFATKISYSIIASAGANGAITPSGEAPIPGGTSGNVSVKPGEGKTFTIAPATDYHIADVLADGVSQSGSYGYGSYTKTFSDVYENHSLIASFAADIYYTITSTAGANGTITPSCEVKENTDKTFDIIPATGYHVEQVEVDGEPIGARPSYPFTKVVESHTISATFAINTYTLTVNAVNGTVDIKPPTGPYTHGTSVTLTPTASTGYLFKDWTGSVTSTTNPLVLTMDGDKTITANFVISKYTITATAGSKGTILPSGSVEVIYGSTQPFVITPNTGYTGYVTVDGQAIGNVASYTFPKVDKNHSISVSFGLPSIVTTTAAPYGMITAVPESPSANIIAPPQTVPIAANEKTSGMDSLNIGNTIENVTLPVPQFTITASAGANGTISPSGTLARNQGSNPTFTMQPNAGYAVANVLVDGSSIGKVTSYTFSNLQTNHTISVTFEIPSTINTVIVNYNTTQTFTITPDMGYTIAEVKVMKNGTIVSQDTKNIVTITGDQLNYTINATFAAYTPQYSWSDESWNDASDKIEGWPLQPGDKFFTGQFNYHLQYFPRYLHSVNAAIGFAASFGFSTTPVIGHDHFTAKWTNGGSCSGGLHWLGPCGRCEVWCIGTEDKYVTVKGGDNYEYLLAVNSATRWSMLLRQYDYLDPASGYVIDGWTNEWNNGGNNLIGGWNIGTEDIYVAGNFDPTTSGEELLAVRVVSNWAALLQFNGSDWSWLWGNGGNGKVGGYYMQPGDRYIAGDFDNDGTDELLIVNTTSGWAQLYKFNGSDWTILWHNSANGWIGGWNMQSNPYFAFYGAGNLCGASEDELFIEGSPWTMVQRYNGSGWSILWHNNGSGYINGYPLTSGQDNVLISKLNYDSHDRLMLINSDRSPGIALMTRLSGPSITTPSGLQASFSGITSVSLKWTANSEPEVTGYNVYQALYYQGTPTYTKLNAALVKTPSFTDNPVIPTNIPVNNYVYLKYYVKAVYSSGYTSDASAVCSLFVGKTISGTISGSTTWDGNRIVIDNVTINTGVTLTINSGVIVRIAPGKNITINSGAKIIANGTKEQQIKFWRRDNTAWGNILLRGNGNRFTWCTFNGGTYNVDVQSTDNVFSNCIFKNAVRGISSDYWMHTIPGYPYPTYDLSTFSLDNCKVEFNSGDGIGLYNSHPSINQSTISNNGGAGIYAYGSGISQFTNNLVENNSGYGIYLGPESNLNMGNSDDIYPVPTPITTMTAGAGKNRINNNDCAIFLDNGARLIAGWSSSSYMSQGFNKISSNGHYICNFAGSSEYEGVVQYWYNTTALTNRVRWGESNDPDPAKFSGSVDYSYPLNFDPSLYAGAWPGTVPLFKVATPGSGNNPATVLTSAMAEKLSEDQSQSSQKQFIVDLKNSMLEKRGKTSDQKNSSYCARLLGIQNMLRLFDPNNETKEMGSIKSQLAEYRERILSHQITDPIERVCSEAALVSDAQDALRNGDINNAQELIKKYTPYIQNKDNKRGILFAELAVCERLGEYAKAWEALKAVKAIVPDEDRKKAYVAPSYDPIETNLREKAKIAGITLPEGPDTQKDIQLPTKIALSQNYPNPFNPTTVMSYQLPVTSYVSLKVYDMLGRVVAVLQDGMKEAGYYSVTFSAAGGSASGGDASKLSSGVYFSRLTVKPQEGNAVVQVKKMVLMK
jgi:hypothetical protein